MALPRLGDSDTEMDDQDEGSWEPEEATQDCSGSGLAAAEESIQGPRIAGGPALLQSRIAGMHWGFEETKVFLAILSESPFSEKLRTCHQNSQLQESQEQPPTRNLPFLRGDGLTDAGSDCDQGHGDGRRGHRSSWIWAERY